jgi:hypothetical protein
MARPTHPPATRSPASTSGGRLVVDRPDDPEFAGTRGEFARLFIDHKADLGMAAASDEFIVEHRWTSPAR